MASGKPPSTTAACRPCARDSLPDAAGRNAPSIPDPARAGSGHSGKYRLVAPGFGVTPMILYPSATGMRGLFSLPNPQQLHMVFQAAQAAKRTATP